MRQINLATAILLASATLSGCVTEGRDSGYHSTSRADASTYHAAPAVRPYPNSNQSTSVHGYSSNQYQGAGGYGSSMGGYSSD